VIVIDASALLEVLLQTSAAPAITDRLFDPAETLHAPFLLDVEILQILRRYALTGQIDEARGREALADFGDLAIERYPHEPLLERAWALRENLTAYDAVYLALAEVLGAVLVTCDGRLARAAESAGGPDVKVAVFPSSGDPGA
jgi:predicted nucleic acid-binding protein